MSRIKMGEAAEETGRFARNAMGRREKLLRAWKAYPARRGEWRRWLPRQSTRTAAVKRSWGRVIAGRESARQEIGIETWLDTSLSLRLEWLWKSRRRADKVVCATGQRESGGVKPPQQRLGTNSKRRKNAQPLQDSALAGVVVLLEASPWPSPNDRRKFWIIWSRSRQSTDTPRALRKSARD